MTTTLAPTTVTTAPPVVCADGSTVAAGSEDDCPPTSIEEFEAAWAQRRAEIVADLTDGGYGVGDDGVLRGPGGLVVDLTDCPAGVNEEAPPGTPIRIDVVAPLSGTIADLSGPYRGLRAYVDRTNEQGGVGGRPIELVTHDDGYVASATHEIVTSILAEGRPMAVLTHGGPTSVAVFDELAAACVPHPAATGHPALGDPVNRPFSLAVGGAGLLGGGLGRSYATEAVLWGEWLAAGRPPAPLTVAAVVMDNEFGWAMEDAFQRWAQAHPHVVGAFLPVRHDPAAVELTAEVAVASAAEPDVMIAMTAGNPCLLMGQAVAALGAEATAAIRVLPSFCSDRFAFLLPAGAAADGWWYLSEGVRRAADPETDLDPYLQWMAEELRARGQDPLLGGTDLGFGGHGWTLVEALRIAAELPGGLTRANLILTLRSLDLDHPMLVPGISYRSRGVLDGHLSEGGVPQRYDADAERWVVDGDVLDLDGRTPNCRWEATVTPLDGPGFDGDGRCR